MTTTACPGESILQGSFWTRRRRRTPLVVKHSSGHMGVFNTLALKILGVTRDTPPTPKAALIGRDDKGEPTGLYGGKTPLSNILKRSQCQEKSQLMEAFDRAQKDYFAYGITNSPGGFCARQPFEPL